MHRKEITESEWPIGEWLLATNNSRNYEIYGAL